MPQDDKTSSVTYNGQLNVRDREMASPADKSISTSSTPLFGISNWLVHLLGAMSI